MSSPAKQKPPRLPNWLLSRFVDEQFHEEFEGDLQELFDQRVEERGSSWARLMYWIDAIHLVGGFTSFSLFKNKNHSPMLFSMMKMAWRTAVRQKQFALLNILGLTLGISTCLVIGLYIEEEMTYDTFHDKGDRIYRINQPLIWGNWDEQFASTGPNVAIALREDAPEFEQVTRILSLGKQTVNANTSGKAITPVVEEKFYSVDPNFFELFSFQFLKGTPQTCFDQLKSIVITEETAVRYFGKDDPIGKSIELKLEDGSWDPYTVTGVLKDISDQSHLQFDMLISLANYSQMMQNNEWKWIFTAFSTYGLVREGTNVDALREKIQTIPPKWAVQTTERIFNQTYEEYTQGKKWTLYLQPLREIYLSSSPSHHRFGPTGNPLYVKIFGAIGILVLVLCCINFMNLSTARSANRAKEVGMRKVMGSLRKALVNQFMLESVLFVLVSTVMGLIIVQLALSAFNLISEKNLELLPHLINPKFLILLFLFIVFLGILAGSYPAIYLSSFKPIETLKGKSGSGLKGTRLRNTLIVFQFTISITLIICTFFVQRQLAYTSSLDIGFTRDNILQLHNIDQLGPNDQVLKSALEQIPAFTGVGKSFDVPPHVWDGERYRAFGSESQAIDISHFRVEEDYLDLLGVEFLAGRNFDPNRPTDKYGVILNEEAVKLLGWGTLESYSSDSPVGKFVQQAFDDERKLEVIGVVKNFNFHSVRMKIDPLMILHINNDSLWNYGLGASFLSMRMNPGAVRNAGDITQLIEDLKTELAKVDPSVPFVYSFLDEEFENTFKAESRMGTVLNIFTGMALTIACLGLFGLSAFAAEQRTRELGIRKVLGASVSQLLFMFTSEFTRLVLISIIISLPVAYFLVNAWLHDFAYRTPMDISVFLLSTLGALVIAIATISYQSYTAASVNPVETLKNE